MLLGLVIVVVASVLVGGIVVLQQRFSPPQNREGYNEVTGSVFEIISVLYAIVLAFVLIAVWEQRSDARTVSYNESNALVDVYWSASDLPRPEADKLKGLCRDYANLAIDHEWPDMAKEREVGDSGWNVIDAMHHEVDKGLPGNDQVSQEKNDSASEALDTLSQARDDRLNAAVGGLTGVMWLVLIAGALLMLGILLLFGVPGRMAHVVVVVIAAAMVVLLLYSVFELEYPFSRGVALGPDAFTQALERMRQIG
ncbi:MAG TPA: hypothetical protein VE172_15975 [Stackebrandtia sp.]|uniref:bestrophin-like domain n=1 Tax=Stackebrandtia sp. TaxID=2023065 RepID=UPI002D2FBB53|nr:hypothetical protein [Stackebrandtia sp.]HZE40302.1 hypothetical protein [Stackebrandtia sp.]